MHISRALCRLRVITSSFDWFTGLSLCFLIGQVITLVLVLRQSIETRSMGNDNDDGDKMIMILMIIVSRQLGRAGSQHQGGALGEDKIAWNSRNGRNLKEVSIIYLKSAELSRSCPVVPIVAGLII